MPALFIQIRVFLFTLMIGLLAGLILNYYQVTVKAAGVGKLCMYILDIILWIIMIVLVFSSMLLINQGEIRVYVLIAFVTGILLYYQKASPRLQQSIQKAAKITVAAGVVIKGAMRKTCLPLAGVLARFRNRQEEEEENPEKRE